MKGGLIVDIKQLRSFVAIVDCQGFSSAANKLNISQATTSTHLSQLEKELGVQLILRSTQSIEVTPAGWTVYKYARNILEMEDHIHESCSGEGRNLLRVAASALPATYMLPEILSRYHDICAKDEFRVIQCSDGEVIQGVLDGRFDVGFADCAGEKDGLEIVPIHSDPQVLLLPAAWKYLQTSRKDIREILESPIILRDERADRYTERLLQSLGIDTYRLDVVGRVNDLEAVKNMVAKEMGIAVISQIAAQDMLNAGRLLQIDLSPYTGGRTISLIYPKSCTARHNAWNFIDYVSVSREFSWNKEQS